jgi:hypothetical protein
MMASQDNFEEEVLTAEEQLARLLQRIENDMNQGRLSIACQMLQQIGIGSQHMLIQREPALKRKYDALKRRC